VDLERLDDTIRVFHAPGWGSDRILHFVTTRIGGVSRPPFDSLNVAAHVGDDPGAVDTNRRRLCAALGIAPAQLCTAEQVHGAIATIVTGPGSPGGGFRDPVPATDALGTTVPGLCLLVSVADCVPVLVADPAGHAIGVAHAGWQGTVAGVAGNLVRLLAGSLGRGPEALVALVGPSIGPADYAVGLEVATRFRERWAGDASRWLMTAEDGSTHLDLWRANADQLLRAGLRPDAVHVAGLSTFADRRHWFSHRRDGAPTGRMGAGLLIRP
jgi:polyphenol oxidase